MSDTIKIKLVKSLIGQTPDNVKTAKALGFRRMNQVLEHKKNAPVMGMIGKIRFMLQVIS